MLDPEQRREAVSRAARPLRRPVLDALRAQQAQLSPSAARSQSLAALEGGAAAVITGQQVGLFGGPLFTLYKAASAVRLSRALAEESHHPVVPIFWVQSEDHDLAEIAFTHVPRPRGAPLHVSVAVPEDNRVPVAHSVLPEEVAACIDAVKAELGNLPHAEAHLSRLARHYQPGRGWAQAFVALMSELFEHTELLFFDARSPLVATEAATVHRRAVADAALLSRRLLERTEALAAQGTKAPIHVREGSPLSFFHPDGPNGPRYRLVPAADGYTTVGADRTFTQSDLLATLERDPLCFSTSALLRPILQDSLLPTAAYVGGPAEVAYFAQLPPLYEAFGLPMPLIVGRARFRIVEERTQKLAARVGVSLDDACLPEDEVLSRTAGTPADQLTPDALEQQLSAGFDAALNDALAKLPPGLRELDAAVEKTRGTVKMAASKFREKYEKTLSHQDRARVEDLRQLKSLIAPEDQPQERFYGLTYFAARYGERALVDRVLESVVPFDTALKDLHP